MSKYLVFFTLLLCNTLSSQNFFTKTYHEDQVYMVQQGAKVHQLDDGGFVLSGFTHNGEIIILRSDYLGNKLWSKVFKTQVSVEQSTLPVAVTHDGEIIIFYIIRSILQPIERHLLKLNANGETLWDLLVNDNQSMTGIDAVISNTGEIFIVSSYFKNQKYHPKLLKFDGSGYLLFSKVFEEISLDTFLCKLLWSPQNQLLLSAQSKIIALNDSGNEQWSLDLESIVETVSLEEDNYMVCTYNASRTNSIIKKIDHTGQLIWEKSLLGSVKNINYKNGDGYIVVSQRDSNNYITKISDNFETEYEWKSWENLNYAEAINNIGYIAIGEFGGNLWLIKMNLSLEFSGVEIVSPDKRHILAPLSINKIEFLSSNVNNVSIELSIDKGISWSQIVSNIPAESGAYEWGILSTEQSDSCLIRITDISNPPVSGISGVFSIKHNKDDYDFISTNNIKMWISNNGASCHNPTTDGSGCFWPKENHDQLAVIYTDGIVYGAKTNNEIKVGGSTYRYGWQAGPIANEGSAADPNDIKYRIHKINKNWELLPDGYEKEILEYDYNNWPGNLGAPFVDVNNDGNFTNGIDLPRYMGDEQLFLVSNDLDPYRTTWVYGSYPIGLEFQQLLFGFDREDGLANVVFKQIKFINKSGTELKDVFIGYFTDGDLGNSNDDYVGCDTTLSLGFIYNGDDNDEGYYGMHPPAIGHLIIQGPIVPSVAADSARFKEKWIKGYKNLPMTAFAIYLNELTTHYNDPSLGCGTEELYNNLRGLVKNGEVFFDPNSGLSTKFCLSGDPITEQGWYEGSGWPGGYEPGDRRYLLSSGPFTMAPGDTQEVVYAVLVSRGSDNLNSITALKKLAKEVRDFYYSGFTTNINNNYETTPREYRLFQNYPNPFNPVTTIGYQIPKNDQVTVKVYDILGREIATLVNEFQKVGRYEVKFNGSQLASGVYIYTIKTNNFTDTRKFVLMK